MVPMEAWLLGGAALAFGLVVWLVHHLREHGDRDLETLADREGWDYRSEPPQARISHLTALADLGKTAGGSAYLSGPSEVGPFEFLGGLRCGASSRPWTLVHVRTVIPCEGLWIGPSPRFRPSGDGLTHEAERFVRRFEVRGPDVVCQERFLDAETRAILLQPQSTVRIGWEGNDFVVAFPVEARSPGGVQILLRYATTLAMRAEGVRLHRSPSSASMPMYTDAGQFAASS